MGDAEMGDTFSMPFAVGILDFLKHYEICKYKYKIYCVCEEISGIFNYKSGWMCFQSFARKVSKSHWNKCFVQEKIICEG